MTYAERVAIDCIDTFENFLEDRGVRVPSSDEQMETENRLTGNSARIYGEDFGELQELLSDDINISMKRISECVFDLTLICADFIRKADIDSRAMFWEIHDWALEFEEQYNEDDDYMTEIEVFGNMKIAEYIRQMPVTYFTYSDMFTDYENGIENENYDYEMRVIKVPRDWASEWVRARFGMSLDEYENEYDYNDSFQMYEDAMYAGVLISEKIEPEGRAK